MSFNNSNIYPDYLFRTGEGNIIGLKTEPTILLIYSGELVVECNNERISAHKGDYLFVKGGVVVNIIMKDCAEGRFCGVFMSFSKSFLIDFYCNLGNGKKSRNTDVIHYCVVKLPSVPCIQSLYISMMPYLEQGIIPSGNIMELKQMEAIYSLLIIDERFYFCFFDFICPWKIDMKKLLNNNSLNKN